MVVESAVLVVVIDSKMKEFDFGVVDFAAEVSDTVSMRSGPKCTEELLAAEGLTASP